jgi:hypothetical protein
MMPFETSCMFSLERVDMLYGENGDMPFTSRVSLRINFYIIREDQVFVVDVVVTNLARETVVSRVIS